jgi:hypothetical protein
MTPIKMETMTTAFGLIFTADSSVSKYLINPALDVRPEDDLFFVAI